MHTGRMSRRSAWRVLWVRLYCSTEAYCWRRNSLKAAWARPMPIFSVKSAADADLFGEEGRPQIDLVVRLQQDNFSAAGAEVGLDGSNHRPHVNLGFLQERRVKAVIMRHPVGDAVVLPFRVNIRPRAQDDVESHLGQQFNESNQVAARIGLPGEIELPRADFMKIPADVGGHQFDAHLFDPLKNGSPIVRVEAPVVHFTAQQRDRAIANLQLLVFNFREKGIHRLSFSAYVFH
jgi:hypothetical protein